MNFKKGTKFLHLQFVGIVLWAGLKVDVYARQFERKSKIPCCVTRENVDGGTVVADPIVKKLFDSIRPPRSTNELKVLGMVLDRRLLAMFRKVRLVKKPKELGIDPVKEFLFNVTISNAVMLPIELGIVPIRELLSTFKKVRDCSAPRLDGMVPVRRLRYKESCTIFVKSLSVAGIGPVRELVSSDSTDRDFIPPTLVESEPVRSFS